MGVPVAYIRRSAKSRSDPGDLSREFQVEEVRWLAREDADSLVIIDRDWGRSAATDKTDRRLAFLELLDRVEAGDVSTLYAYATDRLARSVEWAARLLNACRRAGVTIVTSEGRFEPDNGMTDQLFYFQAMQNEGYSRQATQKRNATIKRQRARGDRIGPAPYGFRSVGGKLIPNPAEDFDAVVAAYREAGGIEAACRLLNARGVPTRTGKPWTRSTLRGMLLARVPELLPATPNSRERTSRTFTLSRLLRCSHDGAFLTGQLTHGRYVEYSCRKAPETPGHPRPFSVSESIVMPWVREEADHLRVPGDVVEGEEPTRERELLEARRKRATWAYVNGELSEQERDAAYAAITEEADRLERRTFLEVIPDAVPWQAPPANINAVLRALWKRIDLDPDLRPVSAIWLVPEWRA